MWSGPDPSGTHCVMRNPAIAEGRRYAELLPRTSAGGMKAEGRISRKIVIWRKIWWITFISTIYLIIKIL